MLIPAKRKEINYELRILDSYAFMSSSLEKLTGSLKPPKREKETLRDFIDRWMRTLKAFPSLNREFGKEKATLLTQKGVFPYEWFDSISKLLCISLPDAEAFRSALNGNKLLDPQRMEYAERIWEKFEMKVFREYFDLYLKTDCLLLTDIVESFREMVITNFGLDPMNYYTTPGMAWDCLLKFSKVELEPITDPNIFLHFEKSI